MKPFNELVIVELAGSVAGSYAGKLFADFGATVLKVEPLSGDPLRAAGERCGRDGMGTLFAYLNTSKQSVVVDVQARDGRAALEKLLAGADAVIESAAPQPLRPLTLELALERLVKVYISPFGLDGPYAGFRSTTFTDYAIGGHTYLNGEPDREPIQGAGRQPEYQAGVHGFIGAMAALWARETTGRGQTVDVSHMEGMASLHQWTTVRYTHGGRIQRRVGNRYDTSHPITIYPCKDGHVAVSAPNDEQTARFLAVAGLSELLEDSRFATGVARLRHWQEFDQALLPWLMEHTAEEIVTLGQAVRVPVGLVPGMLGLLEDTHLAARRYWVTADEGGTLQYPGPPFRLSRHRWSLRPAPRLGEHTIPTQTQPHVASGDRTPSPPGGEGWGEGRSTKSTVRVADQPPSPLAPLPGRERGTNVAPMPLQGVRILDLSRVWAGPLAARILGDLGADVIRVEALWSRGQRHVPEAVVTASARYPNNEAGERPWNREGMFNKFNRNKRAVTIQLETPEGKALFERLLREADVVLENYSPRVMPQLGLGYERLQELNPAIIYIGMPGFGWSGPFRDYVALGTMLEPAAGLSSLMGYPDSGPYKSGVAWADPVAAINAAAAVLIALWDRRADPEGRGEAIELSQMEAMVSFIGEELLAAQVRGIDPPRLGNRDPICVPQGCYPCAGEDRWIAISVTDDAAWAALCRLAAFSPSWVTMKLEERRAAHDAIDDALARWTRLHEHYELMHQLQAAGIAACAVQDAKELVEDAHLAARHFFVEITHPDTGTYRFPGLPIHLSATPATYRRPAPGLGEHNDEVFGGIAGLTAAEIEQLRARGVIGDIPPA